MLALAVEEDTLPVVFFIASATSSDAAFSLQIWIAGDTAEVIDVIHDVVAVVVRPVADFFRRDAGGFLSTIFFVTDDRVVIAGRGPVAAVRRFDVVVLAFVIAVRDVATAVRFIATPIRILTRVRKHSTAGQHEADQQHAEVVHRYFPLWRLATVK